jgi:hypothetical protein
MRVEFFIDPASGWTWWAPEAPVKGGPQTNEDRTAAPQPAAGQGLLVRLLGRVGAWFGVCEQAPSGAWQRVHVPRRDSWEPSARRTHSTVWSWWCR